MQYWGIKQAQEFSIKQPTFPPDSDIIVCNIIIIYESYC